MDARLPRPSSIEVVLVRPRVSANVGAVCRLVRNWGLGGLRLAASRDLNPVEVERVAHGSESVWKARREFPTLSDAVADGRWIVGTTRREGRFRPIAYDARSFARAWSRKDPKQKTLLVFGPEEAGLDREEIDICQALVTIPQAVDHPSLNLSHSVALIGYECFLQSRSEVGGESIGGGATAPSPIEERPPNPYRPPADQAQRKILIDRMVRWLETTGYSEERRGRMARALHQFFNRSFIEEPDIRVFHQWMDHCERRSDVPEDEGDL